MNNNTRYGTQAKVILDSINPDGYRLTTMEVTLHRFVLAELNTHRTFVRNSASSRAIPVEKQLAMVTEHPAFPVEYRTEKPGMSGGEHLHGRDLQDAIGLLDDIHHYTTSRIKQYLEEHPEKPNRLHKSIVNRLIEPFMWHTVIISAVEWQNFFEQRCSPLAQPEIRLAAELMREAYNSSQPRVVGNDSWHTPYIQPEEYDILSLEQRKAVSSARCARVSYLNHDGEKDVEKDLTLYNRLVSARPAHYSPLEHVATPAVYKQAARGCFGTWRQHRHDVEDAILEGREVRVV